MAFIDIISTRSIVDRGNVEVVGRAELATCDRWSAALSSEHKDHRYYEIVEDTIKQGFDYRYFVVRDTKGKVRAVQPFFILDQDFLAGTNRHVRSGAAFIRRWFPRFLFARTLMVGCAAGEGHLDGADQESRSLGADLLASEIMKHARRSGARLIVMKEFPIEYRKSLECFTVRGFTRVPSFPMVVLQIDFDSFDDYMSRKLSRWTRGKLRRKYKSLGASAAITMSIEPDVRPIIDDIYSLYLQVFERSNFQFEKLSKEYFCELSPYA